MMTILLSLAFAAAGTTTPGTDSPATEQAAKPAKPKKVCERIESTGSSVPKKVCRTVKAPTVGTGAVEAAAEKPVGNSTN